MTRKQYSDTEVERLLEEAARQDRARMDDAATERFLSLIREEKLQTTQLPAYKRMVPWAAAAAAVALAAALPLLCNPDPVSVDSVLTASVNQPTGGQRSVVAMRAVGRPSLKRAHLRQIDSTMEAGFSPDPQETYQGKTRRLYGASVFGKFIYSACTDTL